MYLKLLEKNIKQGILNLHLHDGRSYTFGRDGVEANWNIKDESAIKRIARNWEFELGETYYQGRWDAGATGLPALLAVLRSNFSVYRTNRWLHPLIKILQEWNKIKISYAQVSHHYDVPEAVFRKFLDPEMYYSCAYFSQQNFSLAEAQQAKARHIANKLLIQPGNRILDIGCGWGSLAFDLAAQYDCEVVGITLSKEQLVVANKEKLLRGYKNVHFELADYREHQGTFDRIVSVGMFEHVGRPFYNTYFNQINKLLQPNGVALVHTIGRSGPPGVTNPWIRKYIFPGGSNPALSEITSAVESSKLRVNDIEVWRMHYALTLQHWYERFAQNRNDIAALMSEQFCRAWEFYLASCEAAFRYSDLVVYQVQLAKQHGSVPITRDYLYPSN